MAAFPPLDHSLPQHVRPQQLGTDRGVPLRLATLNRGERRMADCQHERRTPTPNHTNPKDCRKCGQLLGDAPQAAPKPAWEPSSEKATIYTANPGELSLYVLGPMTGIPAFNAPAFRDAATILRGMGHTVHSPVEFDEGEGFVHEDHEEGEQVSDPEYFGFLRRDLLRILEADVDGGVALDGWEESRGAALEVHVLRSLGKPIYRIEQEALVEVKAPTKYQPPTDETCLETAARLVDGDRNASYGHPAEDFARTAAMWRGLFGWDVDESRVALAMVCVKLSRLIQTRDHRDSVIDGPGYFRAYEAVLAREGVSGFQDLQT